MEKKSVFGLIKKAFKGLYNTAKNKVWDIKAAYYISVNNDKRLAGERIKVAFIVQMPELWDKQRSIYKQMCEIDDFDSWMIIVPQYDIEKQSLVDYNDEKDYFISQCVNEKYILLRNDDEVSRIISEKFDYVFYQRPYDSYLPPLLRSNNMVKHTRICYIPYAINATSQKNTISPNSFFRNIYFGFLECEDEVNEKNKRFNMNIFNNPRHFLNIGYPCFECCMKLSTVCNYSSFLWTPRWSYDPIIGGSHFMEYCEKLSKYNWGNHRLTVRPHPLMWDNFKKNGILTEEKRKRILSLWEEKEIELDNNETIEKSFLDTDVLITDRSSVIVMFFLTGKPVIYCPMEGGYDSLFSLVLPGLYIAKDWNQLKKTIIMLSNRNDPLLNVRKKIIEEYFSYHRCATKRIITAIIDDCRGK